jgi:hypothetical protein
LAGFSAGGDSHFLFIIERLALVSQKSLFPITVAACQHLWRLCRMANYSLFYEFRCYSHPYSNEWASIWIEPFCGDMQKPPTTSVKTAINHRYEKAAGVKAVLTLFSGLRQRHIHPIHSS